jgi:hypothetical protein
MVYITQAKLGQWYIKLFRYFEMCNLHLIKL